MLPSRADTLAEWQKSQLGEDGAAMGPCASNDESESSETEVILAQRPFGFRLVTALGGKGAIIASRDRTIKSPIEELHDEDDDGLQEGAAVIRVNQTSVEEWPAEKIEETLEAEPLPIALGLRLPARRATATGRVGTKKRGAPSLCTAHCRGSYHVVKDAIERLGYQEIAAVTRDAAVMWLEHSDPTEGLAPVQTISRIEAFLPYCRKARLAVCLNRWLEELPEDFSFTPKTWLLPEDIADLEKHMSSSEHLKKKKTMIAKPTGGSQGRGIVLARKWKDLEQVAQKSKAAMEVAGSGGRSPYEFVVQEYLANPLLLDGLKFDLRLYVVVTSVVPLRAYLFKEGLARFCTVPYQPPKDDNLSEACMHLTNYAVNKKNKDFETTESLKQHNEGSKRSVTAVLKALESLHGLSVDAFWGEVASLAANTLLALRPGLIEYYVHEKPRALHPVGPKGFQIIGLDILIDGDLSPKLLELNANPSLSVTQAAAKKETPAPRGLRIWPQSPRPAH